MMFKMLLYALWVTSAGAQSAKDIIMDIDIMGGIDDVGALAVANVFHNCGLATIRGIAINTSSKYGSLATSCINTYFGNGDIPIAAMKPLTNDTYFDRYTFVNGEYASKIAYNYPRALDDAGHTPDPVQMYRRILGSAEDGSITVVSLGYFDNLATLISSTPDEFSPLGGRDLIRRKVSELVVMGGEYPTSNTIHFTYEFNFGGKTPQATQAVVNFWPGRITFSGYTPGLNVISGPSPALAPPKSPVLAGYEWYVGRGGASTSSWDGLTMLYAVLSLDGFSKIGHKNLFKYQNTYGYNHVSDDGSNSWVNDTSRTDQHWIGLADGVSNNSVAQTLNQFYIRGASQISCTML
ncbi:inosine-uridine nucleoside n-ribohydrolase [Pseudovirgaria hyperparasitica]|uniref:Inosine-uridine nucleoside n-ribohydrolase n=1 Tax=Pseudovirgaria hyperparasitica TaxID=470096 RepID=A0A6A6VV09_9PEZI|nr:inosine-uridine nucleoside n-ribohydrolase [Pseudovirgaria hyperparasitica]KAF2753554.1 inosine-uridine nucleoside n-ribohydrolase [Pseudovirgaria hyperparasitica]